MKTSPENADTRKLRERHPTIGFDDLVQASNDARSMQVVVRFTIRMALFCTLAALGTVGFSRMLAALLLMWALLCAIAGIVKRERLLDSALTSWDEAAFYGLLFGLTAVVNEASNL